MQHLRIGNRLVGAAIQVPPQLQRQNLITHHRLPDVLVHTVLGLPGFWLT